MTSYGKKLRIVYLGALACIAILSVASHLYLSSLEEALANDSPVMNTVGGQRMRSQRISSLSQQVYYELARGDFEAVAESSEKLRAETDEWQAAHRALVSRRGEMGLEGSNSFEIAKSLTLLRVHIDDATRATESLLDASDNPTTFQGDIAVERVAEIVQATERFLVQMNDIADAYETESTSKIEMLQMVEMVSTYLALALLGFLGFAVFEPAIRTLARQESDLLALRSAVDKHTIFSATDVRGRIIDVNDGFCDISGYPRDELVGATHAILNSGHHSDQFWADMWETIKAGNTWRSEVCNRSKDGNTYWVDSTNIPQFDADGQIERFISLRIDITKKKQAEEAQAAALTELDAQRAELEQSQQRFELAIEGSRDAIFDWDLKTGKVWFSPRWHQLLKTIEGAIGSGIPDLLWHVAPEDSERLRLELNQFVESDEERFDSEFQLVDGNDEAVWVMMRAVSFRDSTGRVTRVAGSVADITSLKEAQEAMERLVQQDHLTGLASRTRLTERLEHAVKRCKRNGNFCGVLFFDFDRFKVVNDSLGHDVGDELLCSIAERLRSNVREVDTPARFGGDEFVILLEDLDEPASAKMVADELLKICAAPHQIRGHSLVSTASIGLVTSEHENPNANDLLRYADAAMYEAKRRGRACVVEFDQAMFDAQQQSAELEEALQSAIELDQLELHYQPVIDLQTGAIASAEALLRWNHPTKGFIPPGDFISIAEESKQIVTIGEWVIEEACRQLVDWRNRGIVSEDFAVSVNASKVQLLTPGFERMLVDHVDSYGLPRNVLKIEVTETTIVDNRSDIGDVLRSLRDKSIVIMMDDFGTGHSSLSVLHNLPVDELKIDQSFIRHADKSRDLVAITSSIVTLAEHLSLKTIGEGIEGQEHVALLQTLGCTYGQGYFWSRPVPAAEVEALFQGDRSFSPAQTA